VLEARGAHVSFHDPYVDVYEVGGQKVPYVPLTPEALRAHDVVLIVTDHSVVDYDAVVRDAKLVFDARNATKRVTGERAKVVTL
jgi:UDP-N-acetyl-D-glucosamine dehydrogenase